MVMKTKSARYGLAGLTILAALTLPPREALSAPGDEHPLAVAATTLLDSQPAPLASRPRRAERHSNASSPVNPALGVELSVENGTAPLKAIRINFARSAKDEAAAKRLNLATLRDWRNVLERMPSLELWVVAREADIVGQDGVAGALREAVESMPRGVRSRIRMIPVRGNGDISRWAQDGSKPLAAGAQTVMPAQVLSRNSHEYLDATRALGNNPPVSARNTKKASRAGEKPLVSRVVQGQLPTEGFGNVIVGARHLFVGTDDINGIMAEHGVSRTEALRSLEAQYRKPVLELGVPNAYRPTQVDFHVDLNFSVAWDWTKQEEVVLIESPREGLRALLAGRNPSDLPRDQKEFARALLAGGPRPSPGNDPAAERAFIESFDLGELIYKQRKLDQVAAELKAAGYRVIQSPGIAAPVETDTWKASRTQKIFAFQNAIFSGKQAIVPEVGIARLDQANRELLASLGYKDSIPMPSARKTFLDAGGPRCLAETYRKVLQVLAPRDPAIPVPRH